MAKKNETKSIIFDLKEAKNIVESFTEICGTSCCLLNSDGEIIYETEKCGGCKQCMLLLKSGTKEKERQENHRYIALQSERFGGRYIYSCPAGLCFCASPIIIGGSFSGALIAGPVLITDPDDIITFNDEDLDLSEIKEKTIEFLKCVPHMEPSGMNNLSLQLFTNALYLGDNSPEFFLLRQENKQQNQIGEYIYRLKMSGMEARYPINKEKDLFYAIVENDRALADDILNELLGHIFFNSKNTEESKSRVSELLIVISRAAIFGGVDSNQILNMTEQYIKTILQINGMNQLTGWLSSTLNRFMNMCFEYLDDKNDGNFSDAIEYIKTNYMNKITLEEVAEKCGYSTSYFSHVFKKENGESFKEYLNRVRVEQSRRFLMSDELSISEVSSLTGFGDESYYCKIFRQIMGVTPNKFRKRNRRIDKDKEHGNL